MSAIKKNKIVILGGGMASLTAAFELTNQPGWQDKYEITVYQMGWRIGGKGASGRNRNAQNRIEEHGLHILMGFYDNTFRVMRQCYQELGRTNSQPLASWREAFNPHSFTAFQEEINGEYLTWPFEFPVNSLVPGDSNETLTVGDYICILIKYIIERTTGSFNVNWLVEEDQEFEQIPNWLASLLKERKIELENSSLPGKIPFLHIAYKLARSEVKHKGS
ncbi:MAG: NAD(P)-binding protein, partial [Symploca sp. SIO3E6]|nr:NAD(P)-binding protein [Caldora sp. SIO3E6]